MSSPPEREALVRNSVRRPDALPYVLQDHAVVNARGVVQPLGGPVDESVVAAVVNVISS
jgi:hypothetical protein